MNTSLVESKCSPRRISRESMASLIFSGDGVVKMTISIKGK